MTILPQFTPGYVADGGSAPGDVCDTLNFMRGQGNTLSNLSGPRRPAKIFTDGDSLSVQMAGMDHRSALWWAMAIHWIDVTFGGSLGAGTSMSGTTRGGEAGTEQFGMTSELRLTDAGNAYAQAVADGFAPIVIVSVQTNDNYASDNGQAGGQSTVANVEKYFLRMRAKGLAHMVINGGGPSAQGGGQTLRQRGVALAYRDLAAKYKGQITFVDNSTLLAANATDYRALGGQGVYGATMYDTEGENAGLHYSALGARDIGKWTLGPKLLELIGRRIPLAGFIGDHYDATFNVRGPLMAGQTRYAGATLPTNFVSGTQTVVSQGDVSDPMASALYGRTDMQAREIVLSGTPTSAWSLSVNRSQNSSFDPTTTPFMPEAWVYIDMTNVKCPNFGWASGGVGGQTGRDCDVIPHLKELLCLYNGNTITEGSNFGVRSTTLSVSGIAGKETAGRIVFISASDYPQPPLPAASA